MTTTPQAPAPPAPAPTATADSITALDFDPQLLCEILNCPAPRGRAVWTVRMHALCGCTLFRLCCDPCRRRIAHWWTLLTSSDGPYRCSSCRTVVPEPHTLTFTPLTGDAQ